MRLQSSPFQPDPHVSFLDVIFCLCVFLCCLLSIMLTIKDKAINQVQIKEVVVEKIVFQEKEVKRTGKEDLHTARFRGRGGQPIMNVKAVYYDDVGLIFEIASYQYTWFGFRKLMCNLDRREASGQPAMVFQVEYDFSYRNVSLDVLAGHLDGIVTRDEIQQMKKEDPNNYIVNLYKKANEYAEKKYREFKVKYTTKYLGNWDLEKVGERLFTEYSERKEYGDPYLWFTVDNENKKIILGALDDPLSMSSVQFVDLIASVRGGDGFYIEYRSPETLKYDSEEKIPDWVVKEIIKPLGFSMVANGR